MSATVARASRSHPSGLERGQENPTVAALEGIAAALGVEIEGLFARNRPGE